MLEAGTKRYQLSNASSYTRFLLGHDSVALTIVEWNVEKQSSIHRHYRLREFTFTAVMECTRVEYTGTGVSSGE